VSLRKLYKIRNVSFGDIFIFLSRTAVGITDAQASLPFGKVKISSKIIHFIKIDSFLRDTN